MHTLLNVQTLYRTGFGLLSAPRGHGKYSENLKGLMVKLDFGAALAQLTGTQVGFEYVEANPFGGSGRCHGFEFPRV